MTIASPDAPIESSPAGPRRQRRSLRHGGALAPLDATTRGILNRHPAVGLALGVVSDGRLSDFAGHGMARIETKIPVTQDTVFRVGSITKLFTAIAVMQLVERRLIDLDEPAGSYLRAYRLIPAKATHRPATVRHLLTHTSGIPEVRGIADLLRSSLIPEGGRPAALSVEAGDALPSLAAYYRNGLRSVVEPGRTFAYSNHGFATLGQIVEDVSGTSLCQYLREQLFEPLGMTSTDLGRTEQLLPRLATGYVMRRAGPQPVPDRDWIGAGAGGAYSTARDIARFAAALLGGGANEDGRVLAPGTLATMYEPHFQPDARIPGLGLGFFRHDLGGRRLVGHDGLLPGFNSALFVAPDDGVGVVAFTNGASGAFAWLHLELLRLLGDILGVPDRAARVDVPHHPEVWANLCGRYVLPSRISDLRIRLMSPGGVEVFVRGGRLMVRLLTPIPGVDRGHPLEPDDDADPYVFRLDLTSLGMAPVRVVFQASGVAATVMHTDFGGQPISLARADPVAPPGRALGAVAVAGTVLGVAAIARRAGHRQREQGRCRSIA